MAVSERRMTGRDELELWYRINLRPKIAGAAERRAIDPAQAAELELTMAALIRREPGPRSDTTSRRKEW